MASENAKKDANGVSSMIGILDSDGSSITKIYSNATTHSLYINLSGGGNDNGGGINAHKDQNSVATLTAVSASDGVTIVPLYIDSLHNLLTDNA